MQNEVVAQRGWDKFLVSTDTGLVLVDTESWEVSDAIDGDALEAIFESGDWVPFTGQERVEQAINEALGVPSHELTDAVRVLSLSLFNAGTSQHKGLLFSLWLNDEQARQLAIRGGEPPEKMHVTLCYCGNVETLGDVTIAKALVAAATVASQQKPFTSTITGKGRFAATEFSDWMDVVYAEMECPTIQSFREHLAAALTNAGAAPRGDFEYHPHITLMYVPPGVDDVIDPPKLTFEFRGLTVSVGSQLKTTLPFGEHVNLAAIGPDGKGPYGKPCGREEKGGVWTAVAADHAKYLTRVTEVEREELQDYIDNAELNEHLRSGDPLADPVQESLNALRGLIAKAPPLGRLTVWRAVDEWAALSTIRVGDTLQLPGFQSTTASRSTAVNIATAEVIGPRMTSPVLFEIAPKKGLYIGGRMQEVLLDHNESYKVTGGGSVSAGPKKLRVVRLKQL